MKPIASPEIAYRSDFSLLCNARGLTGIAIEIGTDRAEFAVDFLSRWEGREFICIDPYLPYAEMDRPRNCDRMMAVLALQRFWPRVRMYEMDSFEAASALLPWEKPADFIYIDGAHDYKNVLADIRNFLPLLSPNGIIAGHDYDIEHPGVMEAVNELSDGRQVYLTSDRLASWYCYASDPPTMIQRFFVKGEIANPSVTARPEEFER